MLGIVIAGVLCALFFTACAALHGALVPQYTGFTLPHGGEAAQEPRRWHPQEFFSARHLLLAQAIAHNDMARLKDLARGQDLTQKGKKDMDLLWFAIVNEQFDAIRTLVALGVHPDDQAAESLGSALDFALATRDDARFLAAMLDGGLSPNHRKQPYTHHSPMLERALVGGMAQVQLLVGRGSDINVRDTLGRTALAECTRGKPEIAAYLVQQGADFNIPDIFGYTPLWDLYQGLQDGPQHLMRTRWLALRDVMIARGAQWPPDAPVVVREQMRARGETVRVPRGQAR